jgi:hypothetical protein
MAPVLCFDSPNADAGRDTGPHCRNSGWGLNRAADAAPAGRTMPHAGSMFPCKAQQVRATRHQIMTGVRAVPTPRSQVPHVDLYCTSRSGPDVSPLNTPPADGCCSELESMPTSSSASARDGTPAGTPRRRPAAAISRFVSEVRRGWAGALCRPPSKGHGRTSRSRVAHVLARQRQYRRRPLD